MVYQRIPEHEAFYRQEQNIIERIAAGISSTDDFIRLTNVILARQNDLLALLAGQQPPPVNGGDGGQLPTYPQLGIRSVGLIKAVSIRATDLVYPGEMADCRAARRVLVHINNALDQTIRVTIIGNIASNYSGSSIIDEDICASGEKRTYGLKLEEWMPYIGVQVQALVAPTTGNVDAVAIVQE